MKKEYNRNTISDIPMEDSFNPSVQTTKTKQPVKKKITAIGQTAKNRIETTNSSNKKTTAKKSMSEELKSKLQNTEKLSNLEKINEENLKAYQFKSKRNKVIIVVLSFLLAVAIATISIYLAIIKLESNCRLYVHGASATYYVDGEKMDKFRAPSNLQNDSVLKFDLKLQIKESGRFYIRFTPKCYQKGVLITNTDVYNLNHELFEYGGDGYWYSKSTISGEQTIWICDGITLDYYAKGLNVENFRLEFHTYLEKRP